MLENITRRYYEDDEIVVLDCKKCRTPMVVLRRHAEKATEEEDEYMVSKLEEIMRDCYPGKRYRITKRPRAIPDHIHYHARVRRHRGHRRRRIQ